MNKILKSLLYMALYAIANKSLMSLNKLFLLFIKDNNLNRYIKLCSKIRLLQKFPYFCKLQDNFYLKDKYYLNVLMNFHETWALNNPNYQYLEIGTETLSSFLISKGRINVGVDPKPLAAFRFNDDMNKEFRLNVITSDVFFQLYSDSKIVYDLIFIDGLHTFEQTSKDLVNTLLKTSHNDTDILVHDVIPINKIIANPQLTTRYCTGDAYKLTFFLKLIGVNFQVFLSPPSGLLWIKGEQKEKVRKFENFGKDYQIFIDKVNNNYALDGYEINKFLINLTNLIVDSHSLDYFASNAYKKDS